MTTYSPTNGTEFQAAINSSTYGDTIALTPGVYYDTSAGGGFIFPNKGAGSDFITITTSDLTSVPAKLAALPTNYSFTEPLNYRVTASEAVSMPKIRAANTVGEPAIFFRAGAHHYKFIGIEVLNKDIGINSTMLVGTNTGTVPVTDMEHDLYFDRCFVHPFEEIGDINVNYHLRSVEKGFIMNGSNFTWTHCAIQGFTGWNRYPTPATVRMDTNAILLGSGLGNWQMDHNLLEGQANNLFFGGGGQGAPANHQATMTNGTRTSGTLSQSTDLAVDDMIAVYVASLHDNYLGTNVDDPNGLSPVSLTSGWAVGKITGKSGNNITFENLVSTLSYHILLVKFDTGVTGGTFTLSYLGQTTAPISFSLNDVTLAANIQSALEALPNIALGDISVARGLYTAAPTYGATILFASTFPRVVPSDMVINDSGLTGTAPFLSARIEGHWMEHYSNVEAPDVPSSGAASQWNGYLPDPVNVTNNIIAKYPVWYADMGPQKGFGEMKVGNNVLFEGNIWSGQATGMIFENKNQSGDSPWNTVSNVIVRSNLWTNTGGAIALAPTDYTNRTQPGHDWLITNNLMLNPAVGVEGPWAGNSTSGGYNVTLTHNTIFEPDNMVFAVSGADYDAPEATGFSQLKNWIVLNNIMLQRHYFFQPFTSTPTVPPYNHGTVVDDWPDMQAENNIIINNAGGDSTANTFLTVHPVNYHPDAIATVQFTDAPTALDYTGNYRLLPTSPYKNQGTDGQDPGVNYDSLIAALGFNPFTSQAKAIISGQVVLSGPITIG